MAGTLPLPDALGKQLNWLGSRGPNMSIIGVALLKFYFQKNDIKAHYFFVEVSIF
jgi:hypothetical protein